MVRGSAQLSIGDAVGLAAGFTVGVAFGWGGVVSSLTRGKGVGASPRFALRLLFALPITIAGVDSTRAFAFALLALLVFSLAFAVTVRGVVLEIGKGEILTSLSPVGVPTGCTGWLLGSATKPGWFALAFAAGPGPAPRVRK